VASPEATALRYGEWLDYKIVERGIVPPDLAAAWGAPASAGRAYTICQPASGAAIFLRFVQGKPHPDYRPLRSFGWAAIEICVTDVLAVNDRMLRSPFEIIGPPRRLDGLPTIFPMQIRGPDQEIVFLTQIDGDLPDQDLPRAATLIDKLFILVLACSDMKVSLAWFRAALRLDPGRDIALEYAVLSDAFGLPQATKHLIATVTHERDVFLEVDQYPNAATTRPAHPGELPTGIAMATVLTPDIDAITAEWITAPARRQGALYAGQMAGTVRGPDGSLVEVVAMPG
jgi:hypothetical protein